MYYPMTSSISNGLVALYGSDERIINNNNNNKGLLCSTAVNIGILKINDYFRTSYYRLRD